MFLLEKNCNVFVLIHGKHHTSLTSTKDSEQTMKNGSFVETIAPLHWKTKDKSVDRKLCPWTGLIYQGLLCWLFGSLYTVTRTNWIFARQWKVLIFCEALEVNGV